jgi:hypothetical protein
MRTPRGRDGKRLNSWDSVLGRMEEVAGDGNIQTSTITTTSSHSTTLGTFHACHGEGGKARAHSQAHNGLEKANRKSSLKGKGKGKGKEKEKAEERRYRPDFILPLQGAKISCGQARKQDKVHPARPTAARQRSALEVEYDEICELDSGDEETELQPHTPPMPPLPVHSEGFVPSQHSTPSGRDYSTAPQSPRS